MISNKIIISGTGCSLADFLYNEISFDRSDFKKYLSISAPRKIKNIPPKNHNNNLFINLYLVRLFFSFSVNAKVNFGKKQFKMLFIEVGKVIVTNVGRLNPKSSFIKFKNKKPK